MPALVNLIMKNRTLWEFCWDDQHNGYIHKTKKKTIYKIFFDNCVNPSLYGIEPDIWIGRLIIQNGEKFWVSAQKDIQPDRLVMFRGYYNFN